MIRGITNCLILTNNFISAVEIDAIRREPSRCSSNSTTSSIQGASSPLVDSLLKSLAKDQHPPELRNQTTAVGTDKEAEPVKPSLTGESMIGQQAQLVPNNQVGGGSTLPPRTPIPPESLKCNILKAKSLEQGKNSNLISVSTVEPPSQPPDKNRHTDAATIVSVVSFNCLKSIVNPKVIYYFEVHISSLR